MAPDTHEINGFIHRRESSDYGRSEQSLRREFDEAVTAVLEEQKQQSQEGSDRFYARFQIRPEKFRAHFIVRTKEGTEHSGAQVTKEDVKQMSEAGMKPEWYVSVELLNSRYWEKKKGGETKSPQLKKKSRTQSTSSVKLTDASEIQKLQHELALERERNIQKDEKIETLKADKEFLKEELESRRDDIEDLKGLFQTIDNAATSTARLQSKNTPKPDDNQAEEGTNASQSSIPVDVTAETITPQEDDFWIRNTPNLPTLGKALSGLSKSFKRST